MGILERIEEKLDKVIVLLETEPTPVPEPEPIPEPEPPVIIIAPVTVDLRNPPAGVRACKGDGVTDDTQAIQECFAYAKQEGMSVTQPEGRYLIQPGVIKPFDKMKWYGTGDNRLVTKSTTLYNTMLASWNNIHNILVEGVGFDQTADAALLPDSGGSKGMHMLHIASCNDIELSGCKFWGNGVALQDGFKDANVFRNVEISRNKIDFTYASGENPKTRMDYAVPMNQYNSIGTVSLYTNNSCEDILISENESNFPYTAFNIRAMQLRGSNKHKRIKIYNNKLKDCAIYHSYLSEGYDAIYALEHVDDVEINGNIVSGTPLAISKTSSTATNVKWS